MSTLAFSVLAALGADTSDSFDENDMPLRMERAPTLWKRLMIAFGRRSPYHNAKTITGLRQFLAEKYAAQATKELLA